MVLCRSSSTSTTLPDWQELRYEIHHRIIEVLSFVNVKRKSEALWDYADETLPDVTLINLWATYYEKVMANRTLKILYTTRDPDPPTRALSAQDWDPIHKAEPHFVAMRSEQLLRMADLLEKHPRMPKVAVDPSQEPRRNISHVVMGICHRAKKAFNVRFLSDDAKGSLYMKSELFGLVPFDKDLDILIQTLQSGSYLETIEGDLTGFIRVVTVPILAGWSSRSIVEIKEFRVNNNYLGCVLKGLP